MCKYVFFEVVVMGMCRLVLIFKWGDFSLWLKLSSSDLYNSINNVNEEDFFLDVFNFLVIKGL